MSNNLHEFKFYTSAKVMCSYIADFAKWLFCKLTRRVEKSKAATIEQLYPSQQGVYTFDKADPDTLIKSNKMLIDQTATILAMDEHAFDASMMQVIRYLAKYCLKLPASRFYHHVQPGSLFYHLIETGNEAAQRAKTHPELMMHTDAANRTDYELVFPISAFLLGVLHDIAKPMTDMEVIPLNKLGEPIASIPWQPDEETLYDFLTRCKAYRYKILYRESREYHQHDAYRVWFISKLLSFFPRETGMRDQLKHVIPVHAASKHPLNYIVKEADRVSTKRDTQRYRPFPAITNLAKAFVDVLQDYDMVKRIDDQVELPYFFSEWAIHIPFPQAVRVLVNQVNTRYAAYTDIPLPTDPDTWANLMGAEHGLLVANARASDYRSLKYPDINRFVYEVVVNPGTDLEDRIRVLSLSREHVTLVKKVDGRLKDVAFATQIDNAPDQQQAAKNKTPPASTSTPAKNTTKSKSKAKKTAANPPATVPHIEPPMPKQPAFDIPMPPISDIDFEVPSTEYDDFIAPPPMNMPPPIVIDVPESESEQSEPIDVTASQPKVPKSQQPKATSKPPAVKPPTPPTDNAQAQSIDSSTQVKAKIAPPETKTRPPLTIDFSSLGDLSMDGAKPPTKKPASKTPVDRRAEEVKPVNTSPALDNINELTMDVVTPFEIEHGGDIELAKGRYLKQIPSNHVLAALFNDAIIIYDDDVKLILWALYNDLQQYDLSSLFTKKHREYQVLPEGLAILKSHLDELCTHVPLFDDAMRDHLLGVTTKFMNSSKTDIYQRIFSDNKKRGYRLVNNDIACALLHKDRRALEEYFATVEEEAAI